jgi:hypothetical protein
LGFEFGKVVQIGAAVLGIPAVAAVAGTEAPAGSGPR